MKNLIAKMMVSYWSNEKGLVTIEWVAISAVVVVAGLVISTTILNGAGGFAGAVVGQLDAAAAEITPTP